MRTLPAWSAPCATTVWKSPRSRISRRASGPTFCSTDELWTYEDFAGLVKTVRDNGLEIAAIENFSPRFWSDILLDGPDRAKQIE